MNRFTLIIHNRGWKVQDACEYWGIHYDTYNKRCNSPKFHNQLESMCLGLDIKNLSSDDLRILEMAADLRSDYQKIKG